MKTYAGIGSRKLKDDERQFCFDTGVWLAKHGWSLQTGAAIGADQAFANGALSVGGAVLLCLPSPRYEAGWVATAVRRGAKTRVLNPWDKDAHESVDKFHPNPDAVGGFARLLHARNFLILSGVRFVLAWPYPDKFGSWGGTGQGMRIAQGTGLDLICLDNAHDFLRVERVITAP